MKPENKLQLANVLMVVGILPMLVGSYSMVATLIHANYQQQSEIGLAFMAIGKVIFAYVFAVIVSGSSAIWSSLVETRNAGVAGGASPKIRTLVFIALGLPLVLAALAGM